jgi:DNA-directed RNA polymerase subunit M/transcription elongation factor TFIIS
MISVALHTREDNPQGRPLNHPRHQRRQAAPTSSLPESQDRRCRTSGSTSSCKCSSLPSPLPSGVKIQEEEDRRETDGASCSNPWLLLSGASRGPLYSRRWGIILLNSFPGNVYMTPDRNEGVFLDPESCETLRNSIDATINEPKVAGPSLDLATLRELRATLDESKIPVNEDGPPVVLSRELAIYLELVIGQFFIAAEIPPKIQFSCRTCRNKWIDDPDRLAQHQADMQKAQNATTIMDTVATINMSYNHPFLAILRDYGARTRSQPNYEIRCGRCRGNQLTPQHVIFCPECGSLRDESVVLQCPKCNYDFRTHERGQIWTTSAEALREFNISYKTIAISEKVASLYGGVLPGQIINLTADISPDERLLGVCRCSIFGNRRRDTIILFTSEKIAWTAQGLLRSERGSAKWRQIQEISDPDDGTAGVWLKPTDAAPVFFGGFISRGVTFIGDSLSLRPEGVSSAMRQMLRASRA